MGWITRLIVETLEDRSLLSAAPWSLAINVPDIAGAAPLVAPAMESAAASEAILGTITLVRHGSEFATFAPADDNDPERGIALRAAFAATQPGDELLLAAATYDVGAEHLDFPARVTVRGAGKEATKITSSCWIGVDPENPFTLHNQTVIEDLWLEGSLTDGKYQLLVGMGGDPGENTSVYLRRVKITGDSDGIYLWTGSIYQYSIYGYEVDISTRYDAIAVLGSDLNLQTVKLYNSTIIVAQPSSIPLHVSNAVNANSGFVGLYNCTINVTGDADSQQTAGVWCWNNGSAEIVNCTVNVAAPAGIVYDLLVADGTSCTVIGGQGSGPGGAYSSSSGAEVYEAAQPSTIVTRKVFYNNSAFDDSNPGATLFDSGAIAFDKIPYIADSLPATFANTTSYSGGINGVIVDLVGNFGAVAADDFVFKVGNDNEPENWDPAPAPASVVMWDGAGSASSHRVMITWADGAIRNKWLRVEVLATAATGLPSSEVFYYGNAVGNSGDGDSPTVAPVNVTDELGARNHPRGVGNPAPINFAYDYDRDRTVNSTDELIARNNVTGIATQLLNINLGSGGALAAEASDSSEAALGDAFAVQPFAAASARPARRAATSAVHRRDEPSTTPSAASRYFESLADEPASPLSDSNESGAGGDPWEWLADELDEALGRHA